MCVCDRRRERDRERERKREREREEKLITLVMQAGLKLETFYKFLVQENVLKTQPKVV